MKSKLDAVARFVRDEEAATAAEYGIIAALVGTALVAGLTIFGGAIRQLFTQISSKLTVNS